jgi:hypothetical protein
MSMSFWLPLAGNEMFNFMLGEVELLVESRGAAGRVGC